MNHSRIILTFLAGLMSFSMFASVQNNDDRTPVHRPLIEEYTGTWCGWCVRGLVGMELLRETFGDDFIGVAYHEGDAMEIMYTSQYPNDIDGFPDAFIDRTYEVDPLCGFGNTSGAIVSVMQQFAAIEAIAGVDVTATWTSDDKAAITVDVASYFTTDDNSGKFAIEVMLIADDLYGTGNGWNQKNYYSGDTDYAKDRYLGPWVRKPGSVSGYHFNDVLVGTSGVIAGSLPKTIMAFEDYSYSYTFTLNSLPVPSLIQNKDNLHVIAFVVNTGTGKVINANRCYIDEYVSIIPGDIDDDGEITISDVTALVDYLLHGDATAINVAAADIDADGTININDLTDLIDLLLNKD